MRAWLFFILGIVSVNFVFSQGNLIWPSSSCLDNLDDNGICEELVTNANATIAIQASSFSNITLEGYDNIPTGQNQTQHCLQPLRWSLKNGQCLK